MPGSYQKYHIIPDVQGLLYKVLDAQPAMAGMMSSSICFQAANFVCKIQDFFVVSFTTFR